jgi:spermidine synthase
MTRSAAAQRWLLLSIFLVSGFTGLIYESIWSHYLKLFLGHAAYSQTLVLAMFMGGMALGAWLVARYSFRLRRLLLGYVIVEAAIGVFGLAFHGLFSGAAAWSFDSVIPSLQSTVAIQTFKWSLAGLMILPQSILLGMTFPLISGGIIRRWPERPGQTLALLYFTNSLGAAIGVLVSGFVLIEAVGLPGTILTAGLLNIALAMIVWLIVRRQEEPQSSARPETTADGSAAPRWFLWCAFLTGTASFLYEIGWIRMLSLVLGSSTHSFELMLSAFIFGLACGGLWMHRRIDQVSDPVRYLGILMIVMGGLALLTLPAYNKTFDIMQWAMQTFSRSEEGYTAFNIVGQSIALMIMLPTTFCAGMTLPLLTHALMKRTGSERAIGAVYASNTLGAIAGVLLAVHVLMPLVGVKGVIMSGAAIHMAVGLSGLILLARIQLPMQLKTAGACMVALIAIGTLSQLDPRRMTSGVFRTGEAVIANSEVLYLRDGKTATISVVRVGSGVSIATNGKPDAQIEMSDGPPGRDEITMVLAGALPLSLHPHPERVANIGFGSGLTAHTVLGSENVKQLDSIEIEPLMVEAARAAFYPRVHRVFDDPRSRIVYEDAKTFFASAPSPYDIIISEPSNPWVSGVSTLFSQEFYERIKTYLKDDGYFVQWIQIYETDAEIVASVMKALAKHFPTYAMYVTNESNVLIIATRATELPEASDRIFESPGLRETLARVGVVSVGDLQQRRIGTHRLLTPMFQSFPVPANSDYYPYVDLNAPRARYMRSDALELASLLTLPVPIETILADSKTAHKTVAPAANGPFFPDDFVRLSRFVSDALLQGRTANMNVTVGRLVALVEMTSDRCADASSREAWRRAVREIADVTSPVLPESTRTDLWNRIRSSACYRDHPGFHRDWADLLAAIAAGDAERIESTGEAILSAADVSLSGEERTFAAVAVAAAKLRLGAPGAAMNLLQETADSPDFHRFYELAVRQILALSSITPETAPVDAGSAPVLVERLE